MKTLLRVLGGIAAFLIILAIGLNIYFTDARLKSTVMPYVNDAVGREVNVESMSLTFFSTFPQPGLSIEKMSIPGEADQDTLMSLDELVVGVEFFSLFGDEISVSEIKLNRPRFTYRVYKDSTSNIDFLMTPSEAPEDTAEGYAINIPYFEVTNGTFGYVDETSNTSVNLDGFDANIALRYADLIESDVEINLGGLSAEVGGSKFVSGLPLSLTETSTIDLEQEQMNLTEGTFSIRGLALNLSGNISDWSNAPKIDLEFNSSSDNFGELLRLVPAEYEEHVQELETRGSLTIDGSVQGVVGGEDLPAFQVSFGVTDGYLKNPDLPKPIQDIQIEAIASNDLITIEKLNATAGVNTLSAKGKLNNPLEESGAFALDIDGDVDLATITEFYDISEFDIEKMGGTLSIDATAMGNRDEPEEANFDGTLKLANGLFKYQDVPKAIEDISIDATANQDLITVNSMSLRAATNTFSMSGNISRPMDEANRTVDLETNLEFDLASIKEFYPIDEDTLRMEGLLTAQVSLKGKADQIERSVESGSINLKNGFISHKSLGNPIEDFRFESVLDGNRLTIVNASFTTGKNDLKASGLVTNYLNDNRTVNIQLDGYADFSQISSYYDLAPTITKLTGNANMNLQANGQVDKPAEMEFNGTLTVNDLNMEGDSLIQPITDLNGELDLTPASVALQSLAFNIGSSDISLNSSIKDYMEYLKPQENRTVTPHMTGSFSSQFLNMDELIEWEDTTTTTEPIPIELPYLTSEVTASIEKMLLTGVNMQRLNAKLTTSPDQIQLDQASVNLFEGKATGGFTWKVPRPMRTNISFQGSLDSVRAETFFKEYKVLGEESEFHKYISGTFSAEADYYTELDSLLTPDIPTTVMDGSFGMTKSRLKGHPLQEKLATLFKSDELRNIALDEFQSTFNIKNSVLSFEDLRLTSGDIGVEMNGTQHLINESINYQLKAYLPARFRSTIASVITEQATKALTQENGTIVVPLRVTGTSENPKINPDQEIIKPIIKEYLKGKAGNVLKNLFDGND